ncbi:MAG: permease-like cell division protein FtsX, partial [Fibromonadales bacterium]|nr:permease-like cell division protein FtsX [Fibromonadales bacterium]
PYLIAEAFRGLFRHHLVIIPSLATTFLCSFLLITSMNALSSAVSLSMRSASLYRIEAFFLNTPTSEQADSISAVVSSFESVSSLIYVSDEEAMEDFKQSFPEDMLYLVEGNPLPASLRIQIRANSQNLSSIQRTSERLLAMPEISVVKSPTEWIKRWEEFKWHFFAIPIAVSAFMLIILWMIMWNAMRLTLISRRELVNNIKYSGGTPFFIQFPFVLEGLLQGLIGAGLAAILFEFIKKPILVEFPLIAEFMQQSYLASIFVLLFVATSEAAVCFFTVRKFLTRGT